MQPITKAPKTIIFSPRPLIFITLIALLTSSISSSKSSLHKSTYEQNLLTGEQECNTTLLTAFGVTGDKRPKEAKATTYEKSFCRRNKRSCCSSFNIQSTNMGFAKGATALRQKFEVVEELFSLFRGPLFFEYITEHSGKGQCAKIVEDMSIELNNEKYGFFTQGYQRYELMMIENMLMDVLLYVKKNLWFYGNLVCSACNPDTQKYFNMSKEGSTFSVHTNTCSEMLEEREFERNLLLVYQNYLHKTMQFIECVEDIKDKEEDPDAEEEEEENDVAFIKLSSEETEKFLSTFEKCWDDQNVEDLECVSFCSKSLRLYQFPINNLMHNYKFSLQILYKALTGNEISNYYESIKEIEWSIDHENDAIAFFAQNEVWEEYHFNKLQWTYHSSKGHNIYKEIMSKKYLDFESVVVKGIAIFTSLIMLFLIK